MLSVMTVRRRETIMSLSDEGTMLEMLDFIIHIGSTRTFIIIRFKTATTRRVIVSMGLFT